MTLLCAAKLFSLSQRERAGVRGKKSSDLQLLRMKIGLKISASVRRRRVLNSSAVNVDLGIWGKLSRVVVFLLCIAGLLGVALWYLPLIRQNERMRRVVLQLDTQIAKAEENNRQLKTSIKSLSNDPKAVERLARERLGYAKPGETMIHFDEPMANNSLRR